MQRDRTYVESKVTFKDGDTFHNIDARTEKVRRLALAPQ
jgi:hypothetical protein